MKVKVTWSCPTLSDPVDCSPPGSSVHGILQARVLVWVPFPSPGDHPDSGIQPRSLALEVDSLPSNSPGKLLEGHTWTSSDFPCETESLYCIFKACSVLHPSLFHLQRVLWAMVGSSRPPNAPATVSAGDTGSWVQPPCSSKEGQEPGKGPTALLTEITTAGFPIRTTETTQRWRKWRQDAVAGLQTEKGLWSHHGTLKRSNRETTMFSHSKPASLETIAVLILEDA